MVPVFVDNPVTFCAIMLSETRKEEPLLAWRPIAE
jgi:hypothetical protein